MRNFIKITIIMIIFLVTLQVVSNAATATATWTADKTEVKQGETVTVTLKVKSADKINGVVIENITYDKEKLELQKVEVGENLIRLSSSDTKLEVIANTKFEEADVYKMFFKVKTDAKIGKTEISTSEIDIYTLAEGDDSTVKAMAQTVSLDIVALAKDEEIPGNTDEEVTGKDEEVTGKDTESKEPAPDTGLEDHLFIIIVAVLAVALISYKGYKKFSF